MLQWQAQDPQPPPIDDAGLLLAADDDDEGPPALTDAKADSTRRESSWPCGHEAGSDDSAMGRRASKTTSQVRQRYS